MGWPQVWIDLRDSLRNGLVVGQGEIVLSLVNSWMELVTALNELARSMGHQDFYPFVMSRPVLRKLHFIQLVVKGERNAAAAR